MTPADPPTGGGRFATTQWSVVVAAGNADAPDARRALESLCAAYWYPLYAFARRRGAGAHAAQDLVQGFFAVLLEKDYLAQVDRDRGRFRAFLKTAFAHYTAKEREKARAQKRGGDLLHLSLDFEQGEERYSLEPADATTPDAVFERRWALTMLDRVVARLKTEFSAAGKQELFTALLPFVAGGAPLPTHRDTAESLGMTEGAVKVAVHRLRKRYRTLLREAVADTVSDPADVDAELHHLIAAL
jgi:RNA polymerase sigma-70 factor (ECF subfamily)